MVEIIKYAFVSVESRSRAIAEWSIPSSTIDELRRFLNELALGKVNRGKRICEQRQVKYLDLLRVPLEFINRPTDQIVVGDVERFERALASGEIKSRLKGESYAESTKVDIRVAFKVFLRWRLGESAAVQLAGWLDTRQRAKTPDYLSEEQVDQLIQGCRTAEQRYLVAVLFDAGARAQEFLNIRREDVQLPDAKSNFVRLTLREEFSKTKGRTISLYWPQTAAAVREYVESRLQQGLKAGDPVFDNTYGSMRMFLKRIGVRVLKRRIHPHLFRHSSATYYASKLNRQELCYRFGWRFSSRMTDVYISRAGMETHELDEKFTQTELSTLKDDLARVSQDSQIKSQRIEELQQSVVEMRRHMQLVTELLARQPTMKEVEDAIRRKQRGESST